MRLVYEGESPEREVNVGDVIAGRDDVMYTVLGFQKPHKPAASGRVHVSFIEDGQEYEHEFYVGVIGAAWIEREDRQ